MSEKGNNKELPPVFRMFARHMLRTRTLVERCVLETHWTADSIAAHEVETAFTTDEQKYGPAVRQMFLDSRLLVEHALDHLGGVRALLIEPRIMLAPVSLTRPMVEALAKFCFLMESNVAPGERMRRRWNLQLDDWKRQRTFAELVGMPTTALDRKVNETRRLAQRELSVGTAGHFIGKRKSEESMIVDLLDSTDVAWLAPYLDIVASGVIHSADRIWQLFIDRSTIRPGFYEGSSEAEFGLPDHIARDLMMFTLIGFTRTMFAGNTIYGWNVDLWNEEAPAMFEQLRPMYPA